jgi:hypothetical protein
MGRGDRYDCRCPLFLHRAHEAEALARQSLDQPLVLAAVADGVSCNIDAGREGRIGDDAPLPDGSDKIILTDDALAIANQVVENIKNLRCN